MATWKEKTKGWRYQFEHNKKREGGQWFRTKAQARAAEADHKKRLQAERKKKTPTATTFLEVANKYLDYQQGRLAASTYAYKVIVFRRFIEEMGNLPIDEIDVLTVDAFCRKRLAVKGPISYNRHAKDLCSMFRWAWLRQLIPYNPCHFFEKMAEPKFERKIPTPEEVAKILLAAGEDRPLLLVLYHTLARVDEALRMRWEDVNFERRELRLWTRKRKGGGWESDLIPMNQVLYNTLLALWKKRKSEEWVFINPKTGTRYGKRPKLMHGICKRAQVPPYGFQELRHFVSSYIQDVKKVNLLQVSRLMRHKRKATTERYSQVIDPTLREAMAALETDFLQSPSWKSLIEISMSPEMQ